MLGPVLALLLVLGPAASAGGVRALPPITSDGSQAAEPALEAELLRRANAFRADNGLAPLTLQPQLAAEARAYAGFLAGASVFSHTADGQTPLKRASAAGYDSCVLAENIAYQRDSAAPPLAVLASRP